MKLEKSISNSVIYSYSFYDSHLWLNFGHWVDSHLAIKKREKTLFITIKMELVKKSNKDVGKWGTISMLFYPKYERQLLTFVNPINILFVPQT